MGVYIGIKESRSWSEQLDHLLKVLGSFVHDLELSGLLEKSGITVWRGEPVESLGGTKMLTPSRIDFEEIANELRGEMFYSIRVEGVLKVVHANNKLLDVPCDITASTSNAGIYGDVSLETYRYHGTNFKDYFTGQSPWVAENKEKLLPVLKNLKRDRLVNKIVVGDSIESLQDISSSMYLYYNRVPGFLLDVYGLWRILLSSSKLKEKKSILKKEDLTVFGELAPIKNEFVIESVLSAERFKKSMEGYMEKYVTVEAGSITIYEKQLETTPILRICETILLELRRTLEKTIPKREDLKEQIVKEAQKAEFKEKTRLNHYQNKKQSTR